MNQEQRHISEQDHIAEELRDYHKLITFLYQFCNAQDRLRIERCLSYILALARGETVAASQNRTSLNDIRNRRRALRFLAAAGKKILEIQDLSADASCQDPPLYLESLIDEEWLTEMALMASRTPPGSFVEVGVYKGGSAQSLYRVAQQQKRTLHLFDTFTGIPCESNLDRHRVGDFGDVNIEELKSAMPTAIFHVGVFPQTLTETVTDIAFIHADVDQYDSQRAINAMLIPRLVRGGIMIIDDYFLLRGIHQAIDEDFFGRIQMNGARPFVIRA